MSPLTSTESRKSDLRSTAAGHQVLAISINASLAKDDYSTILPRASTGSLKLQGLRTQQLRGIVPN